MRFGFVGPSYTAQSPVIGSEECINLYPEIMESQSSVVQSQQYGGRGFPQVASLIGTPGLSVFCTLPTGPPRGQCWTGSTLYAVGGGVLYSVSSAGVPTALGNVANDGLPVSIIFNSIPQLLIISGGHAYAYVPATNTLTDITGQLAGTPVKCDYSDTYGIVFFQNSNKYQMSQVLDFTTWPGQLVNEVSVFPDNINSIICNHRELWIFGQLRGQPFYDSGSLEVFDPISGALLEMAAVSPFCTARVDNSVFWVGIDERGALVAYRSNGYTPQRISTHAVEAALSSYANVSQLVSYAYQDSGHLFWVLYIPGAPCSWVYDVTTQLWHKRASWNTITAQWGPHWSWNHSYSYGKHIVGDWNTGNLYQMALAQGSGGVYSFVTDNGTLIRRQRRSPIVGNEMQWQFHADLTVDFDTGLGPQPPLTDGSGNPRAPQAMLRWSDDRGRSWSNEHWVGLGMAGQYQTRAQWRRLGRSRYRVYEVTISDPIPVVIVDAYLRLGEQPQ